MWDPLAYKNNSDLKQSGDAFYALFNTDHEAREVFSGVGGGGTHEILFHIVSVYCLTGTLDQKTRCMLRFSGLIILVVAVKFRGIDEYTGLIKVYDRGIFEYYTAEQLVNGVAFEYGSTGTGMAGRATYWYSRVDGYESCSPKWIVDSLIGNPECND